jgi:hypothetical protein
MLLGQRGKRKGLPLEKRKMLLSGGDISKSTEIASVINDGTENLSIVCDLGKLYSLAGLPVAGQAAGLGEDLTGMMEGFTCGDIESECLLNSNHVDFMEPSFWEDESCDTCLLDVRESTERRYQVPDGEEEETNLDSGSIGIETRCEKEEYETTNILYLNPNHDSTTFQMLAKSATRFQVVGKQIHDSELGDGCYWCPHKVAVGHLIKCRKCTRQFCACCAMNREHGTNIQRQRLEMDDALQLCPRCKNWYSVFFPLTHLLQVLLLNLCFPFFICTLVFLVLNFAAGGCQRENWISGFSCDYGGHVFFQASRRGGTNKSNHSY